MKPHQIFIFVIAVLSGLGVLMAIFPQDGIKINDDFTLQFETWHDFLHPAKEVDISEILANNQIDEEDSVEQDTTPLIVMDTAFIDSMQIVYTPVKISVDSNLQVLDFPEGNDTLLFDFYRELGKTTHGRKIHILHYGDSQIEVDRMTSYFRYRLQSSFTGLGCGFHSGIQAFDFKKPMIVTYSENWHRYKLFPHKDSLVTHRRFGITTSFSMFKAIDDTTLDTVSAWINFETSPANYYNSRKFAQLYIFYGNNKSTVKVNVSTPDYNFDDTWQISEGLKVAKYNFETPQKTVEISYKGIESPEIYGYSFESPSGIYVDNLSVRGSSGLFFGRLDLSLAGQIYNYMNVRLILLQFGGNAVSKDTSYIKSYVKHFGKEISYLQNIAPKAKIIVIGPADMSEKYKQSYVTRKNLPFLIDHLKAEALNRGCAFWNMYEAMGGKNSMASWVFHNPPLAEKDFIHFTPQGAKIIAQMFYKALMEDYNKFIVSQQSK